MHKIVFLFIIVACMPVTAVADDVYDDEILCQAKPNARIEVASPVVGVIEHVFVDRGDTVKAGQPLFALKSSVETAELTLAAARANSTAQIKSKQASLDFHIRKLERNTGMRHQNLISENDLDQVKTERENAAFDLEAAQDGHHLAQLDMAKAQAQLDQRTVRSPINGVVVQVNLPAGNLVGEKPVLVLVSTDPLYIEAAMPTKLFGRFKPNDVLKVSFEVPGVESRDIIVKLIDKVIDAPSNTFGVRLVMPNPEDAVPAGAKCHISVQ